MAACRLSLHNGDNPISLFFPKLIYGGREGLPTQKVFTNTWQGHSSRYLLPELMFLESSSGYPHG